MMDKAGFDDSEHPWIKLVLTNGVTMYGKIPAIKNDLKLLEFLSGQSSAFCFWFPIGVSPVGGGKTSYSPLAGKNAPPGDFTEYPCLTVIRANVVYCGVITGKEQAKSYNKAKQKLFSSIIIPETR